MHTYCTVPRIEVGPWFESVMRQRVTEVVVRGEGEGGKEEFLLNSTIEISGFGIKKLVDLTPPHRRNILKTV